MDKLGRIVRFHRAKAGLSQIRLAKLASIGKTAVFDVENGKLSMQLNTLLKIFFVLNIKLNLQSPLMDECMEHNNEDS